MSELLRLGWLTEASVFELRQRGREVAAEVGFDAQDQIRLAVALSEVGREMLGTQPATVVFDVGQRPQRLLITLSVPGAPAPSADPRSGVAAARRLVDDIVLVEDDGDLQVTLVKALPQPVRLGGGALAELRRRLGAAQVHSPVEELRTQNAELVRTLDQLTQRREELEQLNHELEETNRGVLAMYAQLSEELEETNRGVVALYAELDEKGRQLAEADEAKTRFLRSVSHELRAPVNSILGLSDLLADSALDPEQRTQVGFLQAGARSLLQLVNELLDLARAESGRLQVRLQEVELRALLAELRGTLRPIAAARGVDLVVEEPGAVVLDTDPELLTRVLRNLLTNALAFTEEGEVRLHVAEGPAGTLDLVVSDTGIGIAPEHQDRVFEEFFQVPGHLQARRKGTGLGLPYARHVTEALGGTLTLTSEVGRGSAFTVRLPLHAEDLAELPEGLSLGHVLVADDDPAFRHVASGLLRGLASQVSEAADGAQAIEVLEQARPDAVLLDLVMPRVDGAGVLRWIRRHPDERVRDLRVVVMTSVEIDDEVRRATEAATELLPKGTLSRRRLALALAGGGGQTAQPGGELP